MNEQLLIDIIYFFTRYIVQVIMFYLALRLMLTPKNKMCELICLTIFPALNVTLTLLIENLASVLRIVILILLTVIPAILLFKEPKKRCIFAGIILILTVSVTDIFASAVILRQYGYYPFNIPVKNWDSAFVSLQSDFVFLMFIAPVCILWRKKFKEIQNRSIGLFFLFPVSQVLFLCACSYQSWNSKNFNVFDNIFTIVAVVVSIVADIAMYRALVENSQIVKIKNRMIELERVQKMQYQYYKDLAKRYDEIRKYRHDINNLVSVAEALVENNISHSEGATLVDNMKSKACNMNIPVFCANPIVNTILWQKEQLANDNGVKFTVIPNLNETFPIDRIDLCSLFTNLADNALREAVNHKNAEVTVKASRNMGKLFIEVTNPASDTDVPDSEKPKSTKKEANHGHGIEIINRIAEKYDGTFILKIKDGKAVAKVCLDISAITDTDM